MTALTLLSWFVLVWLLGWIALPVAHRIWAGPAALPDGGLAAGRVLLLAAWTLLAFWLGHLGLPVRWGGAILVLLVLGALLLGWRDREPLLRLVRARWRGMVAVEVVFVLVFLFFLTMRGFWPDIGNGEKPMDLALIGACARADYLPPANPYAAPGRLGSYYYLGHLETALLTDAIGATPRWTYNLMAATLPALCFALLTALCGAVTGRVRNGALAALLVLGSGTLDPLRQWFRPLLGVERRTWPLDYLETSRVIPYTINEYPWFTFSYADLHAHYFDMPLALLLFALGWALYWRVSAGGQVARWVPLTVLVGLLLGGCMVTNTWDFPTYSLFIVLCLAALPFWPGWWAAVRGGEAQPVPAGPDTAPVARKQRKGNQSSAASNRGGQGNKRRVERRAEPVVVVPGTTTMPPWRRVGSGFALWIAACIGVALLALLAARPFLVRLHTEANPPQYLEQPASAIRSWMLLWGLPVGAWVMHLTLGLRGRLNARYPERRLLIDYVIVTVLVVQLLVFLLAPGKTHFVLVYLVLLTVWTAAGAWCGDDAVDVWLGRLALCGLLALIWSETTWAGFLGPPWMRQDTVFKFGMQAWYLIGIASVCSALRRVETARGLRVRWAQWPLEIRYGYVLLLPVAFASSVSTTWARLHHSSTAAGLTVVDLNAPLQFEGWDAWAHLEEPERAAAQWLQDHARDGDNLIETEARIQDGGDYSELNRYTHATGVPSVLGPHAHTFQWGTTWAEVDRRTHAVQDFYGGTDPARRESILDTYQVRYIVAGGLESSVYSPPAIAALDRVYAAQRAFEAGSEADPQHFVRIYDVRRR